MKILFIFILVLSIILSACSEYANENKQQSNAIDKKDTTKQIFMSQETSLRTAEYLTAEIKIPTAVCNMCEDNIVNAVKKLEGVIDVSADKDKNIAGVTFDGGKTTTERIRVAISKAGYDADNVKRDPSAYEKLDDCCKM